MHSSSIDATELWLLIALKISSQNFRTGIIQDKIQIGQRTKCWHVSLYIHETSKSFHFYLVESGFTDVSSCLQGGLDQFHLLQASSAVFTKV